MKGRRHVVGVIDDDASIRGALRRLFRTAHLEVALYPTAEDYLSDPAKQDVDCLVIDVRLPGMTGLELLAKLQSESFKHAILITSFDDEQVRMRALAGGAVGFFLKPFDNRQLQEAVSRSLGTM